MSSSSNLSPLSYNVICPDGDGLGHARAQGHTEGSEEETNVNRMLWPSQSPALNPEGDMKAM